MTVTWNEICGEGLSFSYDFLTAISIGSLAVLCIWRLAADHSSRNTLVVVSGILLSTVGMFGANDLFTSYVCFEMTGFLSWILVMEQDGEKKTGKYYLSWLVITGMIMAMGMFLVNHYAGTLEYDRLAAIHPGGSYWIYAAAACYLIGYGCRCGVFLLHSWMDAVYGQMSLSGGYFMSILVMPGVFFGIYRLFSIFAGGSRSWGEILILLGVFTMAAAVIKCITATETKKYAGYVTMAQMGWFFILSVFLEKQEMLMLLIFFFALSTVVFLGIEREECSFQWASILLIIGQMAAAVFAGGNLFAIVAAMIFPGILMQVFQILSRKHPRMNGFDLTWCSFERLLYRPFFSKALPFVFGVIFRAIDQLPDSIVALLRRTIYQDSKQRVWDKVGTPFTYVIGVIFDEIVLVLNKTILYRRPIRKSFVNGIAVAKKELEVTTNMVIKSVSFGLMLFCIGLFITFIYLLR